MEQALAAVLYSKSKFRQHLSEKAAQKRQEGSAKAEGYRVALSRFGQAIANYNGYWRQHKEVHLRTEKHQVNAPPQHGKDSVGEIIVPAGPVRGFFFY